MQHVPHIPQFTLSLILENSCIFYIKSATFKRRKTIIIILYIGLIRITTMQYVID